MGEVLDEAVRGPLSRMWNWVCDRPCNGPVARIEDRNVDEHQGTFRSGT